MVRLLLQDIWLIEKLAHFDREVKAAIFSKAGKQTPMFARFSTVAGERGAADAERDIRGFALKFYTEDGNWDIVGNKVVCSDLGCHEDYLRYTPTVHNEQSLIAAFVKRSKRDRYREILSTPRLRHKFTNQLAHFADFDPKYRVPIPSNKLFVDNIAFELQKRRSPSIVFAISEDPALDQKELPLLEALKETVGRGMGTVLCCIPGRLAFVETEDERFILERNDPLEKREYIRFVIDRKDEGSHVEQGIFQAVARALEWHSITGCDAEQLNELEMWFGKNLEKPTSFGRDKLRLGICWCKTDATEHISRIWKMVQILERNGIYVKKIRTDRPGYVIYEDEWQLVAEPFRKGTMPRG